MALPIGNGRKFQRKKPRKKRGKGHFLPHAPACPRNKLYTQTAIYFVCKPQPCSERKCDDGLGTRSVLPFPLHPYHMPQTKREGTPSFFPTKYKWMLPLALLEEMEREEKSISDCFPPCNDITALEQAVLCTLAKPAYLCFATYDSFALQTELHLFCSNTWKWVSA